VGYRLAGHFSVDQSAKRIRHYRYAEERMMRVMGGWIALTPELSAKLLLGRHVWDCAQHADLWGKRLPELRAPSQVSEPPSSAFVRFMDVLESPDGFSQTAERLVGIYGVLKPHLLAAYEGHLALANDVYEPPTRRILQRAIEDERRHIAAGRVVLSHHLRSDPVRQRARDWQRRLEALLAEAGGVAGDGAVGLAAETGFVDPEGVAGDLVQLERPAERWPFPSGLEAAVEAHAARLEQRDLRALELDLAPEHQAETLELYRALLTQEPERHEVVAAAKIGAYRFVKLRLAGPRGAAILLTRWVERDGRWRVVEAEVVRTEAATPR
jgi:hypothetical protein